MIKIFLRESKKQELQYTIIIALKSEPDTTIGGLVEDKIKAFPGVLVVSIRKNKSEDYFGNKTHFLKIKFLSSETMTPSYLKQLKNYILTLKDKEGDKVTAVKIAVQPKEVDDYEPSEK